MLQKRTTFLDFRCMWIIPGNTVCSKGDYSAMRNIVSNVCSSWPSDNCNAYMYSIFLFSTF